MHSMEFTMEFSSFSFNFAISVVPFGCFGFVRGYSTPTPDSIAKPAADCKEKMWKMEKSF